MYPKHWYKILLRKLHITTDVGIQVYVAFGLCSDVRWSQKRTLWTMRFETICAHVVLIKVCLTGQEWEKMYMCYTFVNNITYSMTNPL